MTLSVGKEGCQKRDLLSAEPGPQGRQSGNASQRRRKRWEKALLFLFLLFPQYSFFFFFLLYSMVTQLHIHVYIPFSLGRGTEVWRVGTGRKVRVAQRGWVC